MGIDNIKGGFDSPVFRREDDHLGRWAFAKEIIGIATNTPEDWSVRIGVYGDWGYGKTSALYFVEGMAKEKGHIVIRFNPWQFENRYGMWVAFTEAVDSALSEQGIITLDSKRRKTKTKVTKILDAFRRISGTHESIEKVAELGIPFLGKWVALSTEDFGKITEALKTRRILVLIDDIDRADASLVPQLLFALKELLDIPHFSFVLAFDPERVGQALKVHHPGWGEGAEFLEKIVDFPRRLPVPTTKQLLRMVKADIERWCPFVDVDAIEADFDVLPRNPRALRHFIRYLWTLRDVVGRYDTNEFSWRVLILSNLLKVVAPDFAHMVFDSDEYVDAIFGYHFEWDDEDKKTKESTRLRDKTLEMVANQTIGITNHTFAHVKNIAERLAGGVLVGYDATELIQKHAYMAERPEVVTTKEFKTAQTEYLENPSNSILDDWIVQHATRFGVPRTEVIPSLLETAADYVLSCMKEAAMSNTDEELRSHLVEAKSAIRLIHAIAVDLGNYGGNTAILGPNDLQRILNAIGPFVHFTNHPDYQSIRNSVLDIVIKIVEAIETDASPFLELFRPWYDEHKVMPRKLDDVKGFYDEAVRILERKAASGIVAKLAKPGWAENLSRDTSRSDRYILLRLGSPLWTTGIRDELFEVLRSSRQNHTVQENCVELFFALPHELRAGNIPGREETVKFIRDEEVVGALWNAAVCRPLNPRSIGSLRDVVDKMVEAGGTNLKMPPWVEEINSTSLNQ